MAASVQGREVHPPVTVARLAVLGDSDSESYAQQRGGSYAQSTFQWTEVLGRLRPDRLDQGEWSSWGMPGKLTRAWLGAGWPLWWRGPRKFDYRYNFAISGAKCVDLMGGGRQAPLLAELVARDPDAWVNGIVVVRMGGNDFAKPWSMDRLARDPNDAQVQDRISACLSAIKTSVAMLHAQQPRLRVVLVGVFNPVHWAAYLDHWQSPAEVHNIDLGLDVFDSALRGMATSDPRLAFFDDRAWFRRHWGGRDEQGRPNYRPVPMGDGLMVRNTVGDDLGSAALPDGHCGAAWNALWAQALIDLLNERFGGDIPRITGSELATLLKTGKQIAGASP